MTGCSLSKAANKHVCCRKKAPPSGASADDVPTIEIAETVAPVAAPAPAPAPVITIEKMCQAVAEYLSEHYGEDSGYNARYKRFLDIRGEIDDDPEMTSWLTFVKDEISTADKSIEIVNDKRRDIEALQRRIDAMERRADSFEASYTAAKKHIAKLERDIDDAPAAMVRDLEYWKQKWRDATKRLKDHGISVEPPKLDAA